MPPRTRQADPKPADDTTEPAADEPQPDAPSADDVEALKAQIEALTGENATLAAQLAEKADGKADEVPRTPAPDPDMCEEHFPLGWDSPIVAWIEDKTGVVQHEVSCEHGTYRR